MAWRIVGASEHRKMPWKNGGGATAEIAIGPPGASVAGGFDWRLSIASVASDGPFSAFAGYERLITLLSGDGMLLRLDAREEHRLDRAFRPYGFAGERATTCRLLGGPCEDLNLMVARARLAYRATMLGPGANWPDGGAASTRLLFVFRGKVALKDASDRAATLGPRDTLVAGPDDAMPAVRIEPGAMALGVSLFAARGAATDPRQAADR
ncbi:MAG: HutD family protein [Alphaproteobacteria bacterium]|nr:HutD family protein [Alphaproteobacteria bacterium]